MRKKDTINIVKSLDRGPVEFESRKFEHEGDVMTIAQKEVVSIPPTINIKEAAEIMVKNRFRRLPITDPGTRKLLGIITSMDILDFLGGGDKSNILEEKYDDNFLAAINEPIRKIMTRKVKYITPKDSITDAVKKMLKYNIGALPVVNHEKKLVGIVSERDFVFLMAGVLNDEIVADHMTENLITTTPGTPIEGASKIMVRNQFRRLPIVGEERKTPHPEKEKLVGIVTSTDILEFLGSNRVFDTIKTNSAEEALNTPVNEIMEKKVVTINSTSTLGQLYKIMAENDIGGVPVVDYEELLGIITESDLLRAIAL
ncbi:MAG TPA: CBS domain-containing protein, partial [Methanobacteriales archaeon]|nr:MAG: Inosine-5'-monophosphate dehydrogenase related protein III [Methanobacteriaceae archaeon 41_258]MBC7088948.1 CBS domain-containing protein [Methanobacteriaceae archaeon]MBC7097110.1 CBS domain-containing protein [Methanobacteriales archaeon]HIH61547.1 CBS domain-containing protein [Methanobacteriales archaeon]